jgi:hypothetical protein
LDSESEDVPVEFETTAPGVVHGTFEPAEAGQHVLIAETETGRFRHRFLVDEPSARASARDTPLDHSASGIAIWADLLTALALIGWLLALGWERR